MLKTFFAILLTWLIFHWFFPDMDYLLRIYTGAGVILGHDYPFYMKFKGGKGIACSGAMILSFYWGIIPAEVVIFFGIFFLTHYVSLASIFMYLAFMAQLVIFGQGGLLGMSQAALIEMYIVAALLTALALFQHRENIKRLIKGEERKTILKKTKKDGEIGELIKNEKSDADETDEYLSELAKTDDTDAVSAEKSSINDEVDDDDDDDFEDEDAYVEILPVESEDEDDDEDSDVEAVFDEED